MPVPCVFSISCTSRWKLNNAFRTCLRTVTDIPHHERVEYSHLHDFGQKSSRTKFLERLEKLEKERDLKARNEVLGVHRPLERPIGWKPVQLPDKIKRGPGDVLRAMASCVGKDDTAPSYSFHDDPYFIPYNSMEKRDYLLSKDSGRKAARYVLDKHPELFEKNLIEDIPKIPRFMPRLKVSEKNASLELLRNYVTSFIVSEAIETYELLRKKKVPVDVELKQALLELLCYHNSSEEIDEDTHKELLGTYKIPQQKWDHSGIAEQIAEEIVSSEDSTEELKTVAKMALLCGMAKFGETQKALQLFEEFKLDSVGLDVCCYNAVLTCLKQTPCRKYNSKIEAANDLLAEMSGNGVRPDEKTLYCYLGLVLEDSETGSCRKPIELALSAMAEFKNSLGILPSLGSLGVLLKIAGKVKRSMLVTDVVNHLETSTIDPKIPEDFDFFRDAMFAVSLCGNINVAYRLHALALKDPALLGDYKAVNDYYHNFMLILMLHERLDVAMEFYSKVVPNTWTPTTGFYYKLLKHIQTQGGLKHMPKLWTDLQASRFCSARVVGRFEFYDAYLNVVANSEIVQDDADESFNELFEIFLNVARNVFADLIVCSDPTARRINALRVKENPKAISVCNHVLTVASSKRMNEGGELAVADKNLINQVLHFCRSQTMELQGCLDEIVLGKCLMHMIDSNDKRGALAVVLYSAENVSSNSYDMAMQVTEAFGQEFDEVDKNQLNALFSHDTQWVPLS